MRTVRLRVTGRVQGVGYRAFAIDVARGLGLSGWVRNRRDGTVEVLASGSAAAVAELIEACRYGPPAARVAAVDVADDTEVAGSGFDARPTV